MQGEPIRNRDEQIVQWIGAFADIHDQKIFTEKLETLVTARTAELSEKNVALENSESFLLQLIDSSVEFIAVLDTGLNFVAVNKKFEEVIGLPRENIYGKHLFDITPKAKNTEQHKAILKALKGETVYQGKRQAVAKPDYYVDTYFVPLVIQHKIEGVIIQSRNVTDIVLSEIELEQKNAALELSNKELESFNYIASHDLQEPLRKIQTFIHLIEKNKDNQEATEKYFTKIDSSAQRMSELIQSVLTYSRLSKTGDEFIETDLNKTLADVKADLELLIEEKQAVIKSGKLPVIKANALQMHQLFSNLVSNSLKFSKEKPLITISSKLVSGKKIMIGEQVNPDQKFIQLSFTDNGIGFETHYKEKIFNLFQRLHGKHEYMGTGIGLSIVKKIVEHHKGYIMAESDACKGATFRMWIPV